MGGSANSGGSMGGSGPQWRDNGFSLQPGQLPGGMPQMQPPGALPPGMSNGFSGMPGSGNMGVNPGNGVSAFHPGQWQDPGFSQNPVVGGGLPPVANPGPGGVLLGGGNAGSGAGRPRRVPGWMNNPNMRGM